MFLNIQAFDEFRLLSSVLFGLTSLSMFLNAKDFPNFDVGTINWFIDIFLLVLILIQLVVLLFAIGFLTRSKIRSLVRMRELARKKASN